ncbi:MAG: AMIN domain-containing protein, partial [Propionivibrio sp.]
MVALASAADNSIESMTAVQQSGVLNVKMTFKEPLTALPSGFSIAKPARISLDFMNTVNGLSTHSQVFNEGDLKSANIVEAEGRTRVVLNLNQAMTYESTLVGNSLLLSLVPSAKPAGSPQVEHFAQAQPTQDTNTIRDITFRRGKDGEARITVDL